MLDVRVEWCKARARSQRWKEEVELLEEEKHRSLLSLEYQAMLWENARHSRSRELNAEKMDSPLDEGLVAYASRQANIYREITKGFVMCWSEQKKEGVSLVGRDSDVFEDMSTVIVDETVGEEEDLYHMPNI